MENEGTSLKEISTVIRDLKRPELFNQNNKKIKVTIDALISIRNTVVTDTALKTPMEFEKTPLASPELLTESTDTGNEKLSKVEENGSPSSQTIPETKKTRRAVTKKDCKEIKLDEFQDKQPSEIMNILNKKIVTL
jgi:hypothetical protein